MLFSSTRPLKLGTSISLVYASISGMESASPFASAGGTVAYCLDVVPMELMALIL